MDVIGGIDDIVDNSTPTDSKTPFEVLKSKMIDITPEKNGGVHKRVLTPGFGTFCWCLNHNHLIFFCVYLFLGLPIPVGSHVRSILN